MQREGIADVSLRPPVYLNYSMSVNASVSRGFSKSCLSFYCRPELSQSSDRASERSDCFESPRKQLETTPLHLRHGRGYFCDRSAVRKSPRIARERQAKPRRYRRLGSKRIDCPSVFVARGCDCIQATTRHNRSR